VYNLPVTGTSRMIRSLLQEGSCMSDGDGTKNSIADRTGRSRGYSPANFRSRSHDSAHLENVEEKDRPRVHHPMATQAEPEFIDRQSDLDNLIEHLRSAGRFAYDSEFIGELTYIPKLCLIQVASTQRIGLIDPLANLNLTPFWELLCDPSVEKIVHAGQQDVEPIHRNIGKIAANLFDTQICAGLVGLAYPTALSKLVLELVGAKLGKGLTFTHWDQRPLSPMQLRYAADDVRYLLAVREILGQRLDVLGHADWAKLECQSLCDPTQYGFNPKTHYLKIRGANALPARQQAVLQLLTIWRDGCARSHNVPARTFLKDEVLLDLARSPVKTLDKLERVRGLPRPVEAAHGAEIIATTARGLAQPITDLPVVRDFEPTPQQRFQADALYAAFLCLCAGQSIDPSLVASRQEVGDLFRAITAGETLDGNGAKQSPQHGLLIGWRKEAAGQAILDLLAGKLKLHLHWDQMLTTTKDLV
jgi:ribonuclease D